MCMYVQCLCSHLFFLDKKGWVLDSNRFGVLEHGGKPFNQANDSVWHVIYQQLWTTFHTTQANTNWLLLYKDVDVEEILKGLHKKAFPLKVMSNCLLDEYQVNVTRLTPLRLNLSAALQQHSWPTLSTSGKFLALNVSQSCGNLLMCQSFPPLRSTN